MQLVLLTESDGVFFRFVKYCVRVVLRETESSLAITYLCATEDKIIGADGHRLHIAENLNPELIPAGFYRIIHNFKRKILLHKEELPKGRRYADYQSVIDTYAKNGFKKEQKAFEHEGPLFCFTQLIRLLPEVITMNARYFDDAWTESRLGFSILDEDATCVKFIGKRTEAHVMTMRTDIGGAQI